MSLTLFCKQDTKKKLIGDHEKNYENTHNLNIKIVKNGYIIPKHTSDKQIISNGAIYFADFGGVVDNNFNFIESSQIEDGRYFDTNGSLIGASHEDKMLTPNILDEDIVYIGDFRHHPAHFYLETLSRLWGGGEYNCTKIKFAYIGLQSNKSCDFFDFFFEALGIPLCNVIYINKITRCKKIIIPEASFKLNLNYHKKYLEIIDKIKANVPAGNYNKVYFAKKYDRSIGENLAIKLFARNGYKIIYPEELTMKEKISILKGCKNFIASNGSNAHFSIFLSNTSQLTVLNRSDDIHHVQTQIDQLKKINVTYIDCYCDLLPTWLSLGPFAFNFTNELENWLKSNNYVFDKNELIIQTEKNKVIFLEKWVELYSKKQNLSLIENEISIKTLPPSKILNICRLCLGKTYKHKDKSMYYIRKQIKFCGIKIKYKKYIPYIRTFQGVLAVNKDYCDKQMAKFKSKSKPIVKNMVLSMTSYPERIYDIHYAIFSILDQDIQPEKFILWLADEEFPNGEKDIPETILKFKNYGLEIKFTDAIRSFKKIVPALINFPNSILVSADDDIYYPKDWLKKLYNSYKKDPTKIYAHRIHRAIVRDGKFSPYVRWESCIVDVNGSIANYPTSVGGCLYPPNSLYKDATNKAIFLKLCPYNDDHWIWTMALLNKTLIASPQYPMNDNLVYINPHRELQLSGETTLFQINISQNDVQLEALNNYYNIIQYIQKSNIV